MSEVAKLKHGDIELDLPIVTGSENEQALDIGKLRGTTGTVSYTHLTLPTNREV